MMELSARLVKCNPSPHIATLFCEAREQESVAQQQQQHLMYDYRILMSLRIANSRGVFSDKLYILNLQSAIIL